MEWGSVADWLNMLATSALAFAAVYFSVRQYRQQRDSELRVVLKSVENHDGDKHYAGYDLVAINNSEGTSVILQNTTSPLVTEARDDIFRVKDKQTGELVKSPLANKFRMDRDVEAQSTEVLWRFTNMLRGRIPKNTQAGSADEMDWYFYDAVNQRHYQVVLRFNFATQRLVADLHTQKAPFGQEQWEQELAWQLKNADGKMAVNVNNLTGKACELHDTTPHRQQNLSQAITKEAFSVWHFSFADVDQPLVHYYHDTACDRHYQVVVRHRPDDPQSKWIELKVRSQRERFEAEVD